jgi:hypothetical protein
LSKKNPTVDEGDEERSVMSTEELPAHIRRGRSVVLRVGFPLAPERRLRDDPPCLATRARLKGLSGRIVLPCL